MCFVRESLFFQGTTNLGGELPCGPPGEAAHGGEAIRGDARSVLRSRSPSKSSRSGWTPAGPARGSPEVAGTRATRRQGESSRFPIRTRSLEPGSSSSGGPEPGPPAGRASHRAGVWGGGSRYGAQSCQAGPGRQSGVSGPRRLPPWSSSEGRLGHSLPTMPTSHVSPLTSAPDSA